LIGRESNELYRDKDIKINLFGFRHNKGRKNFS